MAVLFLLGFSSGLPLLLTGQTLQAWSLPVFCVAVACDNTAGAMAAATFVAFLMSVCSPAVSATQFALLTSLSSVGQRVFGPLAGRVIEAVGWPGYFAVCAAMALPGLALVWLVTGVVDRGATEPIPGPPQVVGSDDPLV